MGDSDAPIVVEARYRELLELRKTPSALAGKTGAVYALHEATRVLRNRVGERGFVRGAPFMHLGVRRVASTCSCICICIKTL